MSKHSRMEDKVLDLFEKIKKLEDELLAELQKKEREFFYEVRERTIHFEHEVQKRHHLMAKRILRFFRDAHPLNVLTAPVIYSMLIPAAILDVFLFLFQSICFPIYGIPKVRRADYVVIDRQYLSYLNWIERINCVYCGYFNGMMAFSREVAARAEQYWCPIKHARRLKTVHSRYRKFLEYGDAEDYHKKLKEIRRQYEDLI